jgi:hypothetical protein
VAGVPLTPTKRVGQQLVRLVDVSEAASVAGGGVGVVALGQRSVRGLDLRLRRSARHA